MTDPSRLELLAADLTRNEIYPWLTASLIPRAIAWVSSRSAGGVANLAPHSFTTVAGVEPPTLCFVSVGAKDTLANVRATGEFVLNVGTEAMLAAMNDSATNFPAELSEFAEAGIATAPSRLVAPPRVAAAPIVFECRASGEHPIGDCVMIFGEVLAVSADRAVIAADGLPDARAVAPLARLGRGEWATLGTVIHLDRIGYQAWLEGARSDPTDS